MHVLNNGNCVVSNLVLCPQRIRIKLTANFGYHLHFNFCISPHNGIIFQNPVVGGAEK